MSEHPKVSTGSACFIGADQGNDIHVVVGRKNGATYQIIHLEVIPLEEGFAKLEELFYRYNARKMIIDGLPNRHSALSLVSKLPGNRARVAFYTREDKYFQELKGAPQVNINRSMSFDVLQEKILEGNIQFYGKKSSADKMVRLAMSHLTNMKRQEVTRKLQIGGESIEMAWTNTGADHFAHALNYFLVAAESSSGTSFRVVDMDKNEVAQDDNIDPRNNNPYYQRRSLMQAVQGSRRFIGK